MINPRVGEALVAGQREENVAAISNVERDAIGHNQLRAHRKIGASAEFGRNSGFEKSFRTPRHTAR